MGEKVILPSLSDAPVETTLSPSFTVKVKLSPSVILRPMSSLVPASVMEPEASYVLVNVVAPASVVTESTTSWPLPLSETSTVTLATCLSYVTPSMVAPPLTSRSW